MKWKQASALLLAGGMLLCLCACGSRPGGTGGESPDTQDTPQAAPASPGTEAPAPDETAPPAPGEAGPAPAFQDEIQLLSLQKQFYDREDDGLPVRSEYSHVTLWPEDTARYPALAKALEQRAAMIRRSKEEEYDELCTFSGEEPAGDGEGMGTWVSTLDIQVRRADSVAISLLSDSYADYGLIEDYRGMHGTSYDAQTGQELALDDVVKDTGRDLAEAVIDELNSRRRAGETDYRDAVEGYFANTPCDGFSWTLDYNGVTFYFADGDLAQPGNGRLTATVTFARHPELFQEKYRAVPAAYMVELPMDSSFYTDLDGDGGLEELLVTGVYDGDMRMYTRFGLSAGADGRSPYEDCVAVDILPYYVKTASGGHYLYLFCKENEGPSPMLPMFTLRVFDVSGGNVTDVGKMYAGPGLIDAGTYRVPTDPEQFYLDDFDSTAQDMMPFAVGPAGIPEPK